MTTSVKTLIAADTVENADAIESRLVGLGLKPQRLVGAEALPEGNLSHELVFHCFSGDRKEQAALLARLSPHAQVLTVVPPTTDLATMAFLVSDPRCNHAFLTDEVGMARIGVTTRKLISGDIFGIEKYLPEQPDVKYFRLTNYRGRSEVIEKIVTFAEETKVRRQVRQNIAQVCEELLMNALYNAPVDDYGRSLFANVNPKDRLDLESPRPVSIRYVSTEEHFAVAVRDRFGTLTKDTLLRYIHKCLHSKQQIDGKTLGAGLGLYLVVSRSREYVVNIAPGMATEAIAVFSKKGGGSRAPGTLSVYVHPGRPADDEAGA